MTKKESKSEVEIVNALYSGFRTLTGSAHKTQGGRLMCYSHKLSWTLMCFTVLELLFVPLLCLHRGPPGTIHDSIFTHSTH